MRVAIYVNLTRGTFSLCALKSDRTRGKVLAHCDRIRGDRAAMVVSESGRLRSVNKAKEVHAWVACDLVAFRGVVTPEGAAAGLESTWSESDDNAAACFRANGTRTRYNPARSATFTDETGAPVHTADSVVACDHGDGRLEVHTFSL